MQKRFVTHNKLLYPQWDGLPLGFQNEGTISAQLQILLPFYQHQFTLNCLLALLFTSNYQVTSDNLRGVLRKTTIVVKLVLIVVLCSQGIMADLRTEFTRNKRAEPLSGTHSELKHVRALHARLRARVREKQARQNPL